MIGKLETNGEGDSATNLDVEFTDGFSADNVDDIKPEQLIISSQQDGDYDNPVSRPRQIPTYATHRSRGQPPARQQHHSFPVEQTHQRCRWPGFPIQRDAVQPH